MPATGAPVALASVQLTSPLPKARRNIFCVGKNYHAHAKEFAGSGFDSSAKSGGDIPEHPIIFSKVPECVVGPFDAIRMPAVSQALDYEAELAVIIGTAIRRASVGAALDAVAGYAVCNDLSIRDYQRRTTQFLQGKTWDRSTPVGPVLVTPDELPGETAPDLILSCEVDGEVVQKGRTSDLLFGPEELVAYISTIVTLEPGDLVATGTPSGVGMGRSPAVFLKPGQVVRTSIDGIGELVNECRAE